MFSRKGGRALEPKVSYSRHAAVTPLPNHVLQVDFVSGSRLLLDMKPHLDKIRFRPLADARVWNSAVTNGIFVRFGDVELSHDEILSMAEQEH